MLADSIWHGWWDSAYLILALVLPVAVYLLAYHAAIGAGTRWGFAVRSSFDLHRFELYERMGLRRPVDPADEHELANALNRCLEYGFTLPPKFWAAASAATSTEEDK